MKDVICDRWVISTDKRRLDVLVIHEFLMQSYWAKGIPLEIVQRSIDGSLCFGVYEDDRQIGFARVVSDFATFAYLADVYIAESHQKKGLSKRLMECVMRHEKLQGLRRWMLATRDAHGLYERYGFVRAQHPGRLMEIVDPDVYASTTLGGRNKNGI